jgi:hypothetical protein
VSDNRSSEERAHDELIDQLDTLHAELDGLRADLDGRDTAAQIRSTAIETRAWQLYAALVGASLHVDVTTDGEISLPTQVDYVELARLAFHAARGFRAVEEQQGKAL